MTRHSDSPGAVEAKDAPAQNEIEGPNEADGRTDRETAIWRGDLGPDYYN